MQSILTVVVTGGKELESELIALIKQLDDDKVFPLLDEAAKDIVEEGRRQTTKGKTGNLRSGWTKNKLDKVRNSQAFIVRMNYKKAPHAWLVEYGTSHSAPHPYFRPTIDMMETHVYNNLIQKLEKLIEAKL